MFQCPGCGGNLVFDIPSQQLGCIYCGTKYDPYSFDHKQSDAIEGKDITDDYEVTIFTCPECGGEILSTDNAAAGFCSFCGASTILYSRLSKEHRPNYIIPFKKTKEDCKQAFSDLMKKAIFAPNEFKDPQSIDSFRGIYMPYWAYYFTQKGALRLHAEKSHRSGDYIITDHYSLNGDLDAYYKGMSYDASSSFSDSISECLAPYDVKGMKAFTPAYFSGFYADTSDVSYTTYQPEAEQIACDESMRQIKKIDAFSHYTIDSTHNGNYQPSMLYTKLENVDQAMFPVWFMSYRKGDRVAYATVNGQTGKVVSDLPVDIKKYLIGSAILALPIFILLNLLFTITPSTLMLITTIIACICSLLSVLELNQIANHETDATDRGMLSIKDPQKLAMLNQKVASKEKPKKKSNATIISICIMFYVGVTFSMGLMSAMAAMLDGGFIWVILFVIGLALSIAALSTIEKLPHKKGRLGIITSLAAITLGSAVKLLNPPSDIIYYAVTMISLIAVFFTIKGIIDGYNILSTRRLPQFDKQGGDDRA